jgi:spore coat protein U-like protein
MRSIIQTGILLSALTGFAAHATTTAMANFQVKLTITESCTITAVPATADIDFGTVARTTAAVTNAVSGKLSVNCSADTPYLIGLDGGQNSVSQAAPSVGERRMKHSSTATLVPYDLWQDLGHGTFWGNTPGSLFSKKGIGSAEMISVFGYLTNVNFQAGVYTDTVTATITY